MNKKLGLIVGFTILAVSSLACSLSGVNININTDFVKGSGNLINETREVSNINAVSLSNLGELTIINSDKEELVIEADENLLPYITSQVNNGMLTIGTKNGVNINPSSTIHYTLYVTETITALDVSGLGSINTGKIETDKISLVVSGSGNIRLDELTAQKANSTISGLGSIEIVNGIITSHFIEISGSGQLKASDVESEQCNINISGLGNAKVWVTEQLNAEISGSGNIEYYGNPRIQQNVSGLGRLDSMGDH
jgi:hypothetical protein